jgi:hypothetical protein
MQLSKLARMAANACPTQAIAIEQEEDVRVG